MSEPQLAPVIVTHHAIERFQQRTARVSGEWVPYTAAREMVLDLLARSEPDEPEDATQFWHRERRIHRERNRGRECEFWRVDGWRLVMSRRALDPARVLVTCERVVPEEN